MNPVTIVLLVILVILIGVLIGLYFLGKEGAEETGGTAGSDRSSQTDRFHAGDR